MNRCARIPTSLKALLLSCLLTGSAFAESASVVRPASATVCAICGKTAQEIKGVNNWRMCDTCTQAYCWDCFKQKLGDPNFCTKHEPWGKWLIGSGDFGSVTFKKP